MGDTPPRKVPALALTAIASLLLLLSAPGCSAGRNTPSQADVPSAVASPPPPQLGYSGMARFASDQFLVVHDFKFPKDPPRLGVMAAREGRVSYEPVDLADAAGNRPVDLEGVCLFPSPAGQGPEFLATESRRQIWHFRLVRGGNNRWLARCLGVIPLPQDLGDEVEGIAFAAGAPLVLLGLRGGFEQVPAGGGSPTYTPGRLVWRHLDLASHTLRPGTGGEADLPAPKGVRWQTGAAELCADLLLDGAHLMAVASEDPGDAGPFRSLVYRVGTVTAPIGAGGPPAQLGLEVDPDPQVVAVLDGLKVEALAEGPLPPRSAPGAGAAGPHPARHVYVVATDDEAYGGVWRPLFTETLAATPGRATTPATQPASPPPAEGCIK